MSGLEDSLAARKKRESDKRYTCKDLYIYIVLHLSRLYAGKDRGQSIWKNAPSDWPKAELGEWRNPTGTGKDTLPQLKKKAEYMLTYLGRSGVENLQKFYDLMKLEDIDDKDLIHDAMFKLHFYENLDNLPKNFKPFTTTGKPIPQVLVQLDNDILQRIRAINDTWDASHLDLKSNRKRTAVEINSYCSPTKKFKVNPSTFAPGTSREASSSAEALKSYRHILPKEDFAKTINAFEKSPLKNLAPTLETVPVNITETQTEHNFEQEVSIQIVPVSTRQKHSFNSDSLNTFVINHQASDQAPNVTSHSPLSDIINFTSTKCVEGFTLSLVSDKTDRQLIHQISIDSEGNDANILQERQKTSAYSSQKLVPDDFETSIGSTIFMKVSKEAISKNDMTLTMAALPNSLSFANSNEKIFDDRQNRCALEQTQPIPVNKEITVPSVFLPTTTLLTEPTKPRDPQCLSLITDAQKRDDIGDGDDMGYGGSDSELLSPFSTKSFSSCELQSPDCTESFRPSEEICGPSNTWSDSDLDLVNEDEFNPEQFLNYLETE